MRTIVIGCNHRSAPVEVRERIAFDPSGVPRAIEQLRGKHPECEVVLVSTCNRMEFYLARPLQGRPRFEDVVHFLAEFHGIVPQDFATSLYHYEDVEAVRHLFRVVSSLDSMVLGESQILAQTREGFEIARSHRTVGPALEPLFQRAFSVAKDIHTRTAIATGRLSVGSTAVDLARQIFSRFDDKIVMMVGAGKMGELTLTHLLETRPKELWVTNRTDARAEALAARIRERHGVETRCIPFAEWIDRLAQADIVISSTGSREPILTAPMFRDIPARRRYRPILLIDIAVPRDIDPAVGECDEVFLYNIDNLQSVVEASLASRRGAIQQCQTIIEEAVFDYVSRQARRDIGPLISTLTRHFNEIGRRELERVLPKFETLSERDRALLDEMLHRITQKLLHDPVTLLNDKTANGSASVYADTIRALFRLSDEGSGTGR
jgi:glutamyl-tRNA reductase